jgi:Zn-dependent peptidase ImmA (M78 family)/DNA-binding XRE family transcriptional regulator
MNGKRLMLARLRMGLSRPELGEILGVTSRTVVGWEAETTAVPVERGEIIARTLGFPLPFFELLDPANVGASAVSFRSLSRKSATQRDAALAMCDLAVELANWMDPRFGRDKVSIPDLSNEKPEFASELLRREWGLGHTPIANIIHLLEAKGVRLFALPQNCREIDACSFWQDDKPFMLVDTTRSSERIRFNLAHELGHLVLHRHGAPMGQEAEKEANSFASSLLVTIESVQRHLPRQITLETILTLKHRWGVSSAALAYRLNKIGYLSDWHYKSLVIEMRRRGYHETEPNPLPHEVSYVLDFALRALREKGISLRQIEADTYLPHSEIVGLLQGLAPLAISEHEILSPSERRASLRIVG